jgi:hypothetical protein
MTRTDLYEDLQLWRTDVMKLYNSGPGTILQKSVVLWDGEDYSIKKMTAVDLTIIIESAVQYVNYTTTLFDNRAKALKNPNVRFILDNANKITDYFTVVRDKEISDYSDWINTLRTALLCCKSSIGILAFIFSLIVPYFSYNSFSARYVSFQIRQSTSNQIQPRPYSGSAPEALQEANS